MLIWGLLGVFLAIGSIYDKKNKLLPGWFLCFGCLIGTIWGVYRVLLDHDQWQQWIVACLPGILWMVLAFATREQMGYGDGVVLLVVGSFTDVITTVGILMLGLGVGCVCGIVLLLSRRGNRHTALPFIPMLFVAYIIVIGRQILY